MRLKSLHYKSLFVAIALLTSTLAVPPAGAAAPPDAPRLAEGDRLRQLLEQQRWSSAESLAVVAMSRVAASPPVDSLALAEAMAGLVRARIGGSRFRIEGTRALADSAVALRRRHLGPDDPLVAESLAAIARLLVASNDLAGALAVYRQALGIREKAFGPEHRLVAQSLNSLGVVSSQLGDYPAAGDYYRRALAIREKLLGPEHPEVADSWTNLGYVLGETGDYAGALSARRRALEIYEKSLGPDHPRLASALNNLAEGYRAMGDYEESIPLHERALAVSEKAYGASAPELPLHLSNLALNLMLVGDFTRARPLFERALLIREQRFGPDHREVANTLINLAELDRLTGDPARSRQLALRSVSIFENAAGTRTPEVATALLTLGNAQRDLGDLASAEATYDRALAIRRDVFGEDHIRVGEVLREQAVARSTAGDPDAAVELALEAERRLRDHFSLIARVLPEREAIRLAASTPRGLDVALTAGLQPAGTKRTAALWDAVIASRGLVLDEMATRQHVAWRTEAPEVAARRSALLLANRELARLVVQGAGGAGAGTPRSRVDAARQARETAERALAEASAEFRGEQARRMTTLAAVREALPPGTGLVAYVRFPSITSRGTRGSLHYAAFVLSERGAEPRLLHLGDSTAVESLVDDWRREASGVRLRAGAPATEAEAACRKAGDALRRRAWDPVAALLGEHRRVFIVPDGSLHLVNFAALPAAGGGDDRFLVEGDRLFHLVTTERDVARDAHSEPAGTGLLALGGAAFDLADAPAASLPPGAAGAGFRGPPSGCARFRDVRFAALPGSLHEVERVRSLWKSAAGAGGEASVLSGGAATEAAVKSLAPGRRVLHLATHGFFIGRDCEASDEGTRGIGGLVAARPAPPLPAGGSKPSTAAPAGPPANPLRLSGIALAGANHRNAAGPAEEDGVLTAEEIASLDLAGVEWAVLSACDTGLGDVSSGEGVFGLRRALQVAGARSVILGLWSIRDRDALRWMETLYRSRLIDRRDTADAVSEACRALLAERRRAGESTHPFYWAGFLATGDWR